MLAGREEQQAGAATIDEIAEAYFLAVKAKGVAIRTVWKYRTDLDKLKEFFREVEVRLARHFCETHLYRYREWLVGRAYADKTIHGALVLAKQLFKWAWRQGMLPDYRLAAATVPKAKARPQACFTSAQVDQLIEAGLGEERAGFASRRRAALGVVPAVRACASLGPRRVGIPPFAGRGHMARPGIAAGRRL